MDGVAIAAGSTWVIGMGESRARAGWEQWSSGTRALEMELGKDDSGTPPSVEVYYLTLPTYVLCSSTPMNSRLVLWNQEAMFKVRGPVVLSKSSLEV